MNLSNLELVLLAIIVLGALFHLVASRRLKLKLANCQRLARETDRALADYIDFYHQAKWEVMKQLCLFGIQSGNEEAFRSLAEKNGQGRLFQRAMREAKEYIESEGGLPGATASLEETPSDSLDESPEREPAAEVAPAQA